MPKAVARSRIATRSTAISSPRSRPALAPTRTARSRRPPLPPPAWAATPPAVRQGVFLKAADVLESRHDEVVSLLARETGSTFGFAMFQMHFVPGLFRQAAALAYSPIGEVIPSDTGVFAMGCGARSASSARSRRGMRR